MDDTLVSLLVGLSGSVPVILQRYAPCWNTHGDDTGMFLQSGINSASDGCRVITIVAFFLLLGQGGTQYA